MSKSTKPVVYDLFSGAGIFASAFRAEGFDVGLSVEMDKTAAATFVRNLKHDCIVNDITKVEATGRCDVLIAGPPCQGFSTIGRPDGKDPRNKLSLEVVRWAQKAKPQIVVVENVPPFLESNEWQQMRRAFERLGYEISSTVLNAFDFGVPQLRKRSFTFATKRKIGEITPLNRKFNKSTVREAWEGLSRIPNGKNNHFSPIPTKLTMDRIKFIPPEGDRKNFMENAPIHLIPPSLRRLKSGVSDVWGRMKWDRPSNTLRTFMIHPSKGRYLHPEQDRVLSLREAARLQSIPDSWFFEGGVTHVAAQIGNSVPLGLGQAIARAIFAALK